MKTPLWTHCSVIKRPADDAWSAKTSGLCLKTADLNKSPMPEPFLKKHEIHFVESHCLISSFGGPWPCLFSAKSLTTQIPSHIIQPSLLKLVFKILQASSNQAGAWHPTSARPSRAASSSTADREHRTRTEERRCFPSCRLPTAPTAARVPRCSP